jgi:serine/threonine protein kinase
MAGPNSVSDLLELIRQSLPLDPVRLDGYIADLRQAAMLPGKPGELAALLMRDGFLTPFQAEHLMRGRRPRFIIGKYLILDRIGAGGMGAVYFCEHLQLERQVALKVLPADQAEDAAALARFHREAQVVAALNHPNIVRAYDVDAEGRTYFLVMEYVDGVDLQELVARRGRLDAARAACYIRQAAEGLQHAHQARLVHRDVKPANLLLSRSGVVKVLDLGLARFFHEDAASLTDQHSDRSILGTADYVSPEQARDSSDVDIRADVYSLGVTFYFLLTGRAPFADGTMNQKLLWHQMRTPAPVRKLRPEVPEPMAALAVRMMAKDPRDRPQTPAEVAAALAPWTRSAPPPDADMPPPRPTVTAGRPWRKNMPAAAATPSRPVRAAAVAVPLALPSAAPPPVAPAPTAAAAPARTFAAPRAEDDWSSVFDDDPTDIAKPAPTPARRSGTRRAAPSGKRWPLIAGIGLGLVLLIAVGLAIGFVAGAKPAAPSAPSPAPPEPQRGPVHLRATTKGTDAIELTWEDPHGPSTGFRIERATDRRFAQNVIGAKVAGDVHNFTDVKLAPGEMYYYRVRALRAAGESTVSNTAWPPPDYAQGFTPNGLVLNGGAAVVEKALRLTDQNASEARSAFFRQPMDVRSFTTRFRFRISPGPQTADGFTFCIQGGEPTALGQNGGGLGYLDIPKSVAVKFDLGTNDGESPNSTGLFRNGNRPSNLGAIDLTPSGVDLHSGRQHDVTIDYKDGKLTLIIADVDDAARQFNTTFPVNVPGTVGGPTACVGFTGGTGGVGAVQDILSWSWESTGAGE